MHKIIIDEEFKALLPALNKETYELLEENLLQNGCRDSIVVWGDILIDGHNRYEICKKRNISFNTISKDFDSREEALIWIISAQVARRNLTPIQLSHFRGLHYMADRRMQGGNHRSSSEFSKGQNVLLKAEPPGSTAARLANIYNVSSKTIQRDAGVATAIETIGEVSLPAKKKILTGEVNIDKGDLRALSDSPREKIAGVATAIESGAYEKKKPDSLVSPTPERPVDCILAETWSVLMSISNLSDSFSVLHKIKHDSDKAKLRAAIKTCITQLEELNCQLS